MDSQYRDKCKLVTYSQERGNQARYLNPEDIYLPPGYEMEVFAQELDTPTCMMFTSQGDLLVGEAGYSSGKPRVLRLRNGIFEVLAEGFRVPLMGIEYRDNILYVSHRGAITAVHQDGSHKDIIIGLPSMGDFTNGNLMFGPDNKLYFGQGTVTNSGVVGIDNIWIKNHPFARDNPGSYIMVNGQHFQTDNVLCAAEEKILTGAFSPFGIVNMPYETKKGIVKASGCILRVNPDGSRLERFAWGFRNPAKLRFDQESRLFCVNHSYENRGSRPIANAPDEFHMVEQGVWYGWPDYAGGEPVTNPRFAPEGGKVPEFLMTNHPNNPPRPYSIFPPRSTIMGFDFNYNQSFGNYGDVYIAEFGAATLPTYTPPAEPLYTGSGQRVSTINMTTGGVTTFAINKSGFPASLTGEGGFGRPVDLVFGPDGAMYVLDLGINVRNRPAEYIPGTGVIWRITRV